MLRLSNSTIKTYKRCRRHWALGYFWQFGTPPASAPATGNAQLGTRVHTAMESYYGYEVDPIAALDVIYEHALTVHPEAEAELLNERAYANTMVSGYLEWAAEEGIDATYHVISTERVVSTEMQTASGTVLLQAKLDQLVRRIDDDAVLFRDWKTVGTLTKANQLSLDEQMRFYSMMLVLTSEAGTRVDGGLYTMLLRSKRTARATGPFYQQVEVAYNRHDVESMTLRTVETANDIQLTQARLEAGEDHRAVAYPSPGDHCRWACPFTSICPMMDDGSRWQDAVRANFIQVAPYAYYGSDLIDTVLNRLSAPDGHSATTNLPV